MLDWGRGNVQKPWRRWGSSPFNTVPLNIFLSSNKSKENYRSPNDKNIKDSPPAGMKVWRSHTKLRILSSWSADKSNVDTEGIFEESGCDDLFKSRNHLQICSYVLCYLSVSFLLPFVPSYVIWQTTAEACWISLNSSLPF